MAHLTRCFFFSILITTLLHASLPQSFAVPEYRDCIRDVLKWTTWSEANTPLKETLIRNAQYNDRIYQKFREFPSAEHAKIIEKTIDDFDAYDKGFNGPAFKDWLKDNPSKYSDDLPVGNYLSERFAAYEKINPTPKMEHTSQEFLDATGAAAQKCGDNPACNEKEIGSFFKTPKNAKLFRCLLENKEAMRALITDLATMNLGYLKSYQHDPEGGFSYDLMATNLLFNPFLSEKTCRNMIGGTDRLGQKINFGQPVVYKEIFRRSGKNYLMYMKSSLPWTGTYLAFSISGQLLSGKKDWEDIRIEDIGKQILSMTLWDALVAVPIKNIAIKDPIYLRALPKYRNKFRNRQQNYLAKNQENLSPLMQKALKKSLVGEAVFSPLDWGGRFTLSWLNTEAFHLWQKKSDEILGTETRSKKEPQPSPSPANQ